MFFLREINWNISQGTGGYVRLRYFRTKEGVEIDLIVERPGEKTALIEIKSTEKLDENQLRNLKLIRDSIENSEAYCLSRDKNSRVVDGIKCLYWPQGLNEIGLTESNWK